MTKICMVFNHFQVSDGVARSAVGIANYLAEHDQAVVCLRPLFRFDPQLQESLRKNVTVKPVFGFYFRGFAKILDKLPVKLLYRLAATKQYDIEIGFQYGIATKIIAASLNPRARHIGWMHGYDNGLTQKQEYLKMDKMVCVSKCNAERLSRELENSVPVEYSYNLMDDAKIQAQGMENVDIPDKNGITFVTVGRLSSEKGFSRLLDCAARLKKEGYIFKLWIIGNGPDDALLRDKAGSLKLMDEVVFLGEQKNPHPYTAAADVFVCASHSEGYSTVCAEAAVLGVPILTTNVSGGEEIIDTCEAGMLVGMEDEELYQGMKAILDDPDMVSGWKKTLENTKQRFYQSARAEKLMEVLELSQDS